MDIILLEKIEGKGKIGDVVKVKNGFARNFLFPLKKALRATKENIAFFEAKKSEIEKKNTDALAVAEALAKKVDGTSLIVIRGAGDSGHLYGSVSSKDVAEMLAGKGFKIESNCIRIDNPIKEIGIYNLKIVLHADVKANVIVNVARTEDEAKNALKKMQDDAKSAELKATKKVAKKSEEETVIEIAATEEKAESAE
ncbi:MAG: 50S ribosomal protein L9 [Rickettsiales bacterium]|jgi:large subunit ribosomal protein L9|nr:50S ribosomal protein L9 [Rickettsiales bacterium]